MLTFAFLRLHLDINEEAGHVIKMAGKTGRRKGWWIPAQILTRILAQILARILALLLVYLIAPKIVLSHFLKENTVVL